MGSEALAWARKSLEFLKEFAWPFGLCGGAFGILVRFVEDRQISLWLSMAVFSALAALIIALMGYLVREKPSAQASPEVEQILQHGTLLLIARTDTLGVGMGAQIYLREGSHELFLGEGRVVNVQSDGRIRLSASYIPTTQPETLGRLSENQKHVRSNLVIRPGVVLSAMTDEVRL